MLPFCCSENLLLNWLLSQVGSAPGTLFPRAKGWKAHISFLFSNGSEKDYFVVCFVNKDEALVFLPLDADISGEHFNHFNIEKLKREV